MTALIFDFGMRQIGIALVDENARLAVPLTSIEARRGRPREDVLKRLRSCWKPTQIVVGLPLHKDGACSELSHKAHRFGTWLAAKWHLPVEYVDEHLSSREANDRQRPFRGQRLRTQPNRRSRSRERYEPDSNVTIHALAAYVIAETWLSTTSR